MLRFVRGAFSVAGYASLVLDLVLPGSDGIELMQQVPELSDLPVIFNSAYRHDDTVAQALEAGAADYIAKPFSPTELVARVQAALRRHAEPAPFVLGAIAIDYAQRRVTVGGEAVDLTATEYELLHVLSLDAGRVVPFETLLRRIRAERENAGCEPGAHLRPQPAAAQARRQRRQPRLHLQPARRWLPHGETEALLRPSAGARRDAPRPAASALPNRQPQAARIRRADV